MKKTIYIVNVRSTGVNGGIINAADMAFLFEKAALKHAEKLSESLNDDPNGMVYVTGPIILNEDLV